VLTGDERAKAEQAEIGSGVSESHSSSTGGADPSVVRRGRSPGSARGRPSGSVDIAETECRQAFGHRAFRETPCAAGPAELSTSSW